MKLSLLAFLCLLVLACNAFPAADSSEDLKAWQGTWTLVSIVYDGEPQTADMQWIVQGDQYRTRYNQHLDEVPIKFTLDARLKHIDAIHHVRLPRGLTEGRLKAFTRLAGTR